MWQAYGLSSTTFTGRLRFCESVVDALVETSYAHTGGKRRLKAYTINRDSVFFLAAGVSESCNHFTKEHGMEHTV